MIEEGDLVLEELKRRRTTDVAKYMGVKSAYVSHWKRGSFAIQWNVYLRLCEYLGVKHE